MTEREIRRLPFDPMRSALQIRRLSDPFSLRKPRRASRPLAWLQAGVWVALALALTSTGPAARAQEEDPENEATVAAREAQFEALVHEVAGLERQSNVLKKVVKLVSPTVVHIEAEKTDQTGLKYGRRSQIEEAGSGFIIALGPNSYVITNRHVIKQAALRDIKIRLADGRVINPIKVWTDPDTDIAVMAVSASSLVVARLGNSDETEIGDFVLAVGSPFGLSHSVTFGIISAKGRRDLELGDEVHFQDFMQTDAAINPGNSGGPLLNLRGEVIGMNTAIASSSGGNEGIGFTIPINMVKIVARQLVERGTVIRAYLGVGLDANFGPSMATKVGLRRPRGARITNVKPGSPAEAARLRIDDIVLQYDGARVDNDSHLINLVGMTEPGKEVTLTVFRDHKTITVPVRVGTAPSTRPKPQ
jgi:serine protease Do